MTIESPPWRHWADSVTPPGFLGMAEVYLTSGGSIVGDLWKRHGGWLEVLPVGKPPSIIAWLPVAGIRILSEREREQVIVRHQGGRRVRRKPEAKHTPAHHLLADPTQPEVLLC